MNKQINLAVLGAGQFARFAAKAFSNIKGVAVTGVFDTNATNASLLAKEVKTVKIYDDIKSLLSEPGIDLVYIGSPPSLHYQQSKEALHAGKHVICEKPAAIRVSEAEELADYAKRNNLLYVVNLMQRYNPLYAFVTKCVREKILGEFVHGFFENYACDEVLPLTHWFWNEEISGTIFIEHGVHFFDMFTGWLGDGRLLNSIHCYRPGYDKKILDRVQATVAYKGGFVNMYHGFNQPGILDRQELRLQFEKGDITLYEWIPVKIQINALLFENQIEALTKELGGCTVTEIKQTATGKKTVRGNFKDIEFEKYVCIQSGDIAVKMKRYEELVVAMLQDQMTWIHDRDHQRIIDDSNAVESVRIAEESVKKAMVINA